MARRVLRKLRVDFASLVDRPANPGARVMLYKRADPDPDPIDKMIREEDGKYCVYSHSGKLLGKHNTRAEALAQLRAVEANKEKRMSDDTKDTVPAEAEALAKRLSDLEKQAADLTKQLADAEKTKTEALDIAKSERDARLTAEFVRKAEGFAHLAVKADVLGPLLKKLADTLTADEFGQVETVLRAADAAAGTAFVEHGRSGGDAGHTATEKIDTLAKSLIADGKAGDYAAAISLITKDRDNAELLRTYRAEQHSRN